MEIVLQNHAPRGNKWSLQLLFQRADHWDIAVAERKVFVAALKGQLSQERWVKPCKFNYVLLKKKNLKFAVEVECKWFLTVVCLLCCNLMLSSWIELLVPFCRHAAWTGARASAHCLAHRAASHRGRLEEWPGSVRVWSLQAWGKWA